MKNILVLALFSFCMIGTFAQSGKVQSIAIDTVQGAETIYFVTEKLQAVGGTVTLQALCTQTGGTSDGSITLQGSLDGVSYVALTDLAGFIKGYPNDTLTITNGAVASWMVKDCPYNYLRLKVVGTSGDSTKITAKYNIVK
jgi:hypothetical protein